MLTRRQLIMASGSAGAVALAIGLLPRFAANAQTVVEDTPIETYEVTHTDAEWHALLSDDQFAVLRRGGTERPYSNALNDSTMRGSLTAPAVIYRCFRPAPNLTATPAGRASGSRWTRRSRFAPTPRLACCARRF